MFNDLAASILGVLFIVFKCYIVILIIRFENIITLDTRRLSRIDLNLLVAFQVLLEEQNVSKAAERLFITQSAMSKTLARLRELFDDHLFTRSSHGMVPTPAAIEIHAKLEELLINLDGLIGYGEMDPSQFQGHFNISALDHFILPIVPKLTECFINETPELSLKISQNIETQFRAMAEGRVDLAIGGRMLNLDDDLIAEKVSTTLPIFLMRADHPLKQIQNPSWRDIMQYPEVKIIVTSAEYRRASWIQQNFARFLDLMTVVLESPDYLVALQTVAHTDALLFTPRLSLDFVKATGALTSMALPGKEGQAEIDIMMTYHKRTANSPMHKWVREHIKLLYADLQEKFDRRHKA